MVALVSFGLLAAASCTYGETNPAKALKTNFPKLTFDTIKPSPVTGVYEVVSGDNVLYYDPVSNHIIFGEMWSGKGINVTAGTREKLQTAKLAKIRPRFADAIKVGNGKAEVVEFIDPDCPFCRKMASFWQARADVTRYVFLLPLKNLHPQSEEKIAFILSSKDREKALEEVVSGKYDGKALPKVEKNDRLIKAHAEVASSAGMGGTPAYYVNGVFVNGANVPTIEKLLARKGEQKK